MYMLWSEETFFFFPAHTQAVPFAYEMHSGDENVKEGAAHSATHYKPRCARVSKEAHHTPGL